MEQRGPARQVRKIALIDGVGGGDTGVCVGATASIDEELVLKVAGSGSRLASTRERSSRCVAPLGGGGRGRFGAGTFGQVGSRLDYVGIVDTALLELLQSQQYILLTLCL